MGKENTPKEFKDKLNQLIELLNKLREYYIKNKKAIDDFLNGGEDFIEEQKKIVDDGTVKRERGNYKFLKRSEKPVSGDLINEMNNNENNEEINDINKIYNKDDINIDSNIKNNKNNNKNKKSI